MSDQAQPTASQERPRGKFRKFFGAFEGWYERIHKLDRRKRRKHQAQLYGLAVAVGVPLMGWLVHDLQTKLLIACLWFALAPNQLFWMEGMGIDSQIKRYGLLDQEESDYQRKAMYSPYFGVILAVVIWIVSIAAYIPLYWPSAGWWADTRYVFASFTNTPVHYGLVEWGILAHTVLIGYQCIDVYYPLISNFLQATAGQRRLEKETVTVNPSGH